jgi:hypothetical protein
LPVRIEFLPQPDDHKKMIHSGFRKTKLRKPQFYFAETTKIGVTLARTGVGESGNSLSMRIT